jgi:hypothetical protein
MSCGWATCQGDEALNRLSGVTLHSGAFMQTKGTPCHRRRHCYGIPIGTNGPCQANTSNKTREGPCDHGTVSLARRKEYINCRRAAHPPAYPCSSQRSFAVRHTAKVTASPWDKHVACPHGMRSGFLPIFEGYNERDIKATLKGIVMPQAYGLSNLMTLHSG